MVIRNAFVTLNRRFTFEIEHTIRIGDLTPDIQTIYT